MDRGDKTILFLVFVSGVLLISMIGSTYYPNHTEEITAKKVIAIALGCWSIFMYHLGYQKCQKFHEDMDKIERLTK